MRVLRSTIHGADVEGEVIGGERFDPLTETATWIRSSRFVEIIERSNQAHSWLVDVTVLKKPSKFYVM